MVLLPEPPTMDSERHGRPWITQLVHWGDSDDTWRVGLEPPTLGSVIQHLYHQTVDMHREKVARREIGAFTVTKRYSRNSKVIAPAASKDPKPKYSRTPISYSSLDSVGHGMKDSKPQERKATINRKHGGTLRTRPTECPVAPSLSRGTSVSSLTDKSITSSFGKAVPPPVVPSWPMTPEADIVTTLLEDTAPAPQPSTPIEGDGAESEIVLAPPPAPPLDMCDFLPPPPMTPLEADHDLDPAPPLETVPEENGLPPPETDALLLPAPPPFPHSLENGEARRSRRPRGRHPPSTRSLSLRLRSGSAPRQLHTRSLFLSNSQSLIIPPPPPYPPPLAPPTLSTLCRIPARLQHLDLEIPGPPPPPPIDDIDGFEEIPPLPPPVDYDISAPAQYLEKVVALYDYRQDKPEELTFQQGDVIYLTKRNEDGWCEGILNGVEGFFPGNYVESAS